MDTQRRIVIVWYELTQWYCRSTLLVHSVTALAPLHHWQGSHWSATLEVTSINGKVATGVALWKSPVSMARSPLECQFGSPQYQWQGRHWSANLEVPSINGKVATGVPIWKSPVDLEKESGNQTQVCRSRGGHLNHWAKEAVDGSRQIDPSLDFQLKCNSESTVQFQLKFQLKMAS